MWLKFENYALCEKLQRFLKSKTHNSVTFTFSLNKYGQQENILGYGWTIAVKHEQLSLQRPLQTYMRTSYVLRNHKIPLPEKKAETVTRAFEEHFVLKYGVPKEALTHQSAEFHAQVLNV